MEERAVRGRRSLMRWCGISPDVVPVHAPGECAWAGVTGGYAQINNSGADFVQHQVVSSSRLPTSDATRALLFWISPAATREMPSSHRSGIAPWSAASFGLATNHPAGQTDPDLVAGPFVSLV